MNLSILDWMLRACIRLEKKKSEVGKLTPPSHLRDYIVHQISLGTFWNQNDFLACIFCAYLVIILESHSDYWPEIKTDQLWKSKFVAQLANRVNYTRVNCEVCSKLTIKTPQQLFWCLYCQLWHISHLVLVFLLLTSRR